MSEDSLDSIERNSNVPAAAFAVGIAPVSKEAGSVEYGMKKLHSSLTPLQPVATTLCAGRLDPTQISFVSRKMMEMAKIPSGDLRVKEPLPKIGVSTSPKPR